MLLFDLFKKKEKPTSTLQNRNSTNVVIDEEEEEDSEWVVLPPLSACIIADSVELYRLKRDEDFAKKYIKPTPMSGYEV